MKFQGHTGWKFKSNLSKITRPVAAIKSLRFALLLCNLSQYLLFPCYDNTCCSKHLEGWFLVQLTPLIAVIQLVIRFCKEFMKLCCDTCLFLAFRDAGDHVVVQYPKNNSTVVWHTHLSNQCCLWSFFCRFFCLLKFFPPLVMSRISADASWLYKRCLDFLATINTQEWQ